MAKGMADLTSKAELRQRWQELHALDDNSQERGYQLEQLIFELLALEELAPSPSYKSEGEQIDGFFEMDGRYFLVEMKWQKDPLPASEIYAFRAKVEGKLVGTVGVFIAINGFSEAAPNALRSGKEINVLLFDRQDLDYALMDEHSFRKVLKAKLRYAAQYGVVDSAYERNLKDEVPE